MNQTIEAYRQITVTPEFRESERLYSKARHDEAQALFHAKKEARLEEKFNFAKSIIADDEPFEKIIKYTGLTFEEVKSLCEEK